MSEDIDEELRTVFKEEARDNLEKIYTAFKGFAEADNRKERIDAIFRALHTIKGGAGMFGQECMQQIAHKLESSLSKLKEKPDLFNVKLINQILAIVDLFEPILEGKEFDVQKIEFPQIENLEEQKPASTIKPLQESEKISESEQSQTLFTGDSEKGISKGQEVIRVPVDRVQRNFDIVSEIFLIRNQMSHTVETEYIKGNLADKFYHHWEMLDTSLRQRVCELENIVLSMRMMPIKNLFTRMEKQIRSYCATSGKKIKAIIEGDETELDKKILDSLADPLTHLIRNAMDHGIEEPDVRLQSSKSETGSILLKAHVESNEVVIEIRDDGKGIDGAKIRKIAQAQGIDVSQIKSEEEAVQLIFAPGLSTAQSVSQISGRGVGMDAVKFYVESSGGKIYTTTKLGEGTTFILKLPIGMSVVQSIVVNVGSQRYGIPAFDIAQTVNTHRHSISKNGKDYYLNLFNEFIPCIFLENIFQQQELNANLIDRKITAVVAYINGKRAAFVVSSIESNTELVAKPLPLMSPKIPFVSGVAILATGVPVFMLSLRKLFFSQQQTPVKVHEVSRDH